MLTDEEMAAAIGVALEPLAQVAEQAHDFNQAFDETHLRLMQLFDKIYDAGIKYGLHVSADEQHLRGLQ